MRYQFLELSLKIRILELVKDFFGEENIHIPFAVLYEIAKTDLIADLLDNRLVLVKMVTDAGTEVDFLGLANTGLI